MADQTNDTERKIREEDEKLRQRQDDTTGQDRPDYQDGSSSPTGGRPAGEFAQQGRAAMGGAVGGAQGAGTVGTIGGQTDNEYGAQGAGPGQGAAGAQSDRSLDRTGSQSPLGAGHEQSADGGSVTAAGSGSTGPGAGQAGTDRSPGFIGSQGEESNEHLQDRDPQQAGFAEQGRGAPDEGRDIERGGERTANLDSDIEGSSKDR